VCALASESSRSAPTAPSQGKRHDQNDQHIWIRVSYGNTIILYALASQAVPLWSVRCQLFSVRRTLRGFPWSMGRELNRKPTCCDFSGAIDWRSMSCTFSQFYSQENSGRQTLRLSPEIPYITSEHRRARIGHAPFFHRSAPACKGASMGFATNAIHVGQEPIPLPALLSRPLPDFHIMCRRSL